MKLWMVGFGFSLALASAGGCGSDDEFTGSSAGRGAAGGSGGGAGRGGAGRSGGSAGSAMAGEGGEGDPGTLSNEDDLRVWANAVSALGVFTNIYQLVAVADGEDTFADADCPTTTDDGTTLEIDGDCIDSSANEWIGRATVVRSGGDRTLTYDGFGTRTNTGDDTQTGTAHIVEVDADDHDFDLSLVHDGEVTITFEYEGHVTGDYGTRTVWSGSGDITREGGTGPLGTVHATTANEVVDDTVCQGAPSSGTTVIDNDRAESVVITYDGNSDCDSDQAAQYSVNGTPRGAITGIACAVSRGFRGDRSLGALLLALGVGLAVRRRRR